jgi:outer membrane biosynthesis protein TonB
MRTGGPILSLLIHAAIFAAGIIVVPHLTAPPTPMVILPVELLSISDSTNVAPVAEKAPKDAAKAEDPTVKANAETAPKPQDEKPESIAPPAPTEKPKAPDPEPKKEEARAAPEQKKPEKMTDTLDSILKSVDKKSAKNAAQQTATNLAKVGDAARQGVGDNQHMTMTYADFIRSQLMKRGCWTDKKDMPDARLLRAVIRVRFSRGGMMSEEPRLIDPERMPAGNPPLNVFMVQALASLKKCEPFTIPPEYFESSPYIDLTFLP